MIRCLHSTTFFLCEHPFKIQTHFINSSNKSRNRKYTEMDRSKSNNNGFVDEEVVVGDPLMLHDKKAAIRVAGHQKLQVIADFDRTLTKFWIDGRQGQSSHGLLQQDNPVYDAKRQELYEYYHPIEFNPEIPLVEKAKLMEEWWGKTHALLIEGGLTYDAIKTSVANATIAFREGVVELFEYLEEKDVPVLIFSAGLADIIEEVLRQKLHRSFKNVKIVSNRMVFNHSGRLESFKGKLIHVLNKNEHALDMAAPLHDHFGDADVATDDYASVKKRTNVLLLGDHIGDLGMSDGLNYETRISVGFLNDHISDSLSSYREAFDLVYLNDAPMWGVVDLVSQLCSESQMGNATRSQYCWRMSIQDFGLEKGMEQDMEIGYEDKPSPLTLEALEKKFFDEKMKLAKEESEAEDAENARHMESKKR